MRPKASCSAFIKPLSFFFTSYFPPESKSTRCLSTFVASSFSLLGHPIAFAIPASELCTIKMPSFHLLISSSFHCSLVHFKYKKRGIPIPLQFPKPDDEDTIRQKLKDAIANRDIKEAELRNFMRKNKREEMMAERDIELITKEERYSLRKSGLRKKNTIYLGRRGVYSGTIENIHLHFKRHETVLVECTGAVKKEIQETAEALVKGSGAILIDIHKNFIILYRGKNYLKPKLLRPINMLDRRKALEKSTILQSLESHAENVRTLRRKLAKVVAKRINFPFETISKVYLNKPMEPIPFSQQQEVIRNEQSFERTELQETSSNQYTEIQGNNMERQSTAVSTVEGIDDEKLLLSEAEGFETRKAIKAVVQHKIAEGKVKFKVSEKFAKKSPLMTSEDIERTFQASLTKHSAFFSQKENRNQSESFDALPFGRKQEVQVNKNSILNCNNTAKDKVDAHDNFMPSHLEKRLNGNGVLFNVYEDNAKESEQNKKFEEGKYDVESDDEVENDDEVESGDESESDGEVESDDEVKSDDYGSEENEEEENVIENRADGKEKENDKEASSVAVVRHEKNNEVKRTLVKRKPMIHEINKQSKFDKEKIVRKESELTRFGNLHKQLVSKSSLRENQQSLERRTSEKKEPGTKKYGSSENHQLQREKDVDLHNRAARHEVSFETKEGKRKKFEMFTPESDNVQLGNKDRMRQTTPLDQRNRANHPDQLGKAAQSDIAGQTLGVDQTNSMVTANQADLSEHMSSFQFFDEFQFKRNLQSDIGNEKSKHSISIARLELKNLAAVKSTVSNLSNVSTRNRVKKEDATHNRISSNDANYVQSFSDNDCNMSTNAASKSILNTSERISTLSESTELGNIAVVSNDSASADANDKNPSSKWARMAKEVIQKKGLLKEWEDDELEGEPGSKDVEKEWQLHRQKRRESYEQVLRLRSGWKKQRFSPFTSEEEEEQDVVSSFGDAYRLYKAVGFQEREKKRRAKRTTQLHPELRDDGW